MIGSALDPVARNGEDTNNTRDNDAFVESVVIVSKSKSENSETAVGKISNDIIDSQKDYADGIHKSIKEDYEIKAGNMLMENVNHRKKDAENLYSSKRDILEGEHDLTSKPPDRPPINFGRIGSVRFADKSDKKMIEITMQFQ